MGLGTISGTRIVNSRVAYSYQPITQNPQSVSSGSLQGQSSDLQPNGNPEVLSSTDILKIYQDPSSGLDTDAMDLSLGLQRNDDKTVTQAQKNFTDILSVASIFLILALIVTIIMIIKRKKAKNIFYQNS